MPLQPRHALATETPTLGALQNCHTTEQSLLSPEVMAMSLIGPAWPSSSSTQSPMSRSHTRAVPSVEAVIASVPEGVSSTCQKGGQGVRVGYYASLSSIVVSTTRATPPDVQQWQGGRPSTGHQHLLSKPPSQ